MPANAELTCLTSTSVVSEPSHLLISLSIAFISVAPEARKSFTCIASLLISFRLKSARTNRAFAFFKGTCTRGIYDNMNTAVETVFIGKDRQFNRRFLRMCGHYLVELTACTPASGWEKGGREPGRGGARAAARSTSPPISPHSWTPKPRRGSTNTTRSMRIGSPRTGGAFSTSQG